MGNNVSSNVSSDTPLGCLLGNLKSLKLTPPLKASKLKESLISDINYLQQEYKSTAIITKDCKEAEKIYDLVKDEVNVSLVDANSVKFSKDLIVIPAYTAKGLEFDSVIIYNDRENSYRKNERNLLYVACTRCQHELYIYN